MTDLLDFEVDALKSNAFDSRQSVIAPLPGETEHPHDPDYMDIVTMISLLTSSRVIDYQMITDFFLTFRSFISQQSLLKLLILRLKWSIQCINDAAHELKQNIGKLTLVRTFVVIRHWLLNYFSEDFISSEPLRQLFIDEINSLRHSELFVQRVIINLKKNWTNCCDKAWDENVSPDDFYNFMLKIGPQSDRSKRLSVFALNQRSDPLTRNSMMLSLYERNTIHKLPIPIMPKYHRREPQLHLNPKNSILRFSMAGRAALDHSAEYEGSSEQQMKNPLYISLNRSQVDATTTLRKNTKFPQDSVISKLMPPTPVKKMEFIIPLPAPDKPQPKGLRHLVESWIKTFTSQNNDRISAPQAEKFMASVVSVAKLDNVELEKLAEGRFDILSARTIDELEYLVRFHNDLMGRHFSSNRDASFSFTIDGDMEKLSNVDNLNLYETISNISKNVLTIQKEKHNQVERDTRSQTSQYGSVQSNKMSMESIDQSTSRKQPTIEGLHEFDFENYGTDSRDAESDKFEFENDGQSIQTFPKSIISESTPRTNELNGQRDGRDGRDEEKLLSLDLNSFNRKHVRPISEPLVTVVDRFTYIARPMSVPDVSLNQPTAVNNKGDINSLSSHASFRNEVNGKRGHCSEKSMYSTQDSEYDDIESFVSNYEDSEDMDVPESMVNNNSDLIIDNEPSTPPSQDGIISSTPQISPIKTIQEDASSITHISPVKKTQDQFKNLDGNSRSVEPIQRLATKSDLDLNRVPSFTRISDASISSEKSYLEEHMSYLSKRSIKTQRGSGSINSIFSGVKTTRLVNVTVKQEYNVEEETHQQICDETQSLISSTIDNMDSTINSDDLNIPFPMNGVDSHVMAELAAISDDSYQEDPVQATLLKLEGNYTSKKNLKKSYSAATSVSSSELVGQVEDLAIHTPVRKQQAAAIDHRRRTRLFSLTPVRQKEVNYDDSSSKILLELLLSHKVTKDILRIQNAEHHASFILNYDSKTIAEQLTLIEKDALLEIDWRELVDLTWESDKLQPVNSWLALLVQNEGIQGIDLCSSRFNLTVNWIISEILLTKNQCLQKMTIQRFIHVAQNCKVLQNYSTMMQIVLALISSKVMALKETWRSIEPGDILIFKNLEKLCSPSKNFMNLRLLLNDIKPSLGCVPFIGLYLSDLYFNNKEKRSTNGSQINFGKFKMTAKIVRSLIQCIQWSMLYRFETNEEVLSKCLYIKALTDDEMNECARGVQG
jgi:GDP/GTP exchange factor required for growth at low temperature